MATFAGILIHLPCKRVTIHRKCVQERTLPYPAVTGEDGKIADQQSAQVFNAFSGSGGTTNSGDRKKSAGLSQASGGGKIRFIDAEDRLDSSARSRDQIAVDQTRPEWGIFNRGYDNEYINVGCDDSITMNVCGIGPRERCSTRCNGRNLLVMDSDLVARRHGKLAADVPQRSMLRDLQRPGPTLTTSAVVVFAREPGLALRLLVFAFAARSFWRRLSRSRWRMSAIPRSSCFVISVFPLKGACRDTAGAESRGETLRVRRARRARFD